jgi:hypothetical protein
VIADENADIVAIAVGGTFAQSITLGGSVSINALENTVEARVSGGSILTATGMARVKATDDATIVPITGQVATTSGYTAIGAAISKNLIGDTITAVVTGPTTRMTAPTIEVLAEDNQDIDAVALGGSFADQFALGGSVAINDIGSTIEAWASGTEARAIDTASDVVAPTWINLGDHSFSTGQAVRYQSNGGDAIGGLTDDTIYYIRRGGVPAGGVQLAPTQMDALRGTNLIVLKPQIATGSSHTLTAATGGAVAKTFNPASDVVVDPKTWIDLGARGLQSGQAVRYRSNGDTAIGGLTNDTVYYIRVGDVPDGGVELAPTAADAMNGTNLITLDPTPASGSGHTLTIEGQVTLTATAMARIEASDDAQIVAVSGSGAGASNSEAVGAAISKNLISDTVKARMHNAALEAPTIQVKAHTNSDIDAISIGVAGAQTVALAGSVSLNEISNTVEARITGPTGSATGDTVTVAAVDDALIEAVSGSGAGALEFGAVGAAGSTNTIGGTTTAAIEDATVSGTTVHVHAGAGERAVPPHSDTDPGGHIVAISVGGAGAQTAALAGSVSLNEIARTVEARISKGANVDTTGPIRVTAFDDSTIFAVSGQGTGASWGAAGAAVAKNEIDNTLRACVSGANTEVTSSGSFVELEADSDAVIRAITLSGSGAGTFAGTGSFAFNSIGNTVESYISGGAEVHAAAAILLTSTDDSTISTRADAGAGAGGVSVAGALAKNNIHNQVRAFITDPGTDVGSAEGTVPAASRVELSAMGRATIETDSNGGGGAGTFSLTGSVSINEIENVLEAFVAGGATVTASGDIAISASDISTIGSLAGQGVGAGIAAIGAAASYNAIANTVRAYADNATLTSSNGSVIFDASEDPTILTIAVGGGGAVYVSIQASVAVNNLENTVEAYIANGSTVTADDNVLVGARFDGGDPFTDPPSVDPSDSVAVASLVDGAGLDGINAFAGAFGGAFVGAGAGMVLNHVENTTRAFVEDL